MYTGTLIRELLATVEQAEHRAEQKQFVDESDLQMLFESQIPPLQDEPVFVGAA